MSNIFSFLSADSLNAAAKEIESRNAGRESKQFEPDLEFTEEGYYDVTIAAVIIKGEGADTEVGLRIRDKDRHACWFNLRPGRDNIGGEIARRQLQMAYLTTGTAPTGDIAADLKGKQLRVSIKMREYNDKLYPNVNIVNNGKIGKPAAPAAQAPAAPAPKAPAAKPIAPQAADDFDDIPF